MYIWRPHEVTGEETQLQHQDSEANKRIWEDEITTLNTSAETRQKSQRKKLEKSN